MNEYKEFNVILSKKGEIYETTNYSTQYGL